MYKSLGNRSLLVRNSLLALTLAAGGCGSGGGGDGSDDNQNPVDIPGLTDGEFRLSTTVIRYGSDAYEVAGDISPGVAFADTGESVTFTITTDENSRIYEINGCDGTLNGDSYTVDPVTEECEITLELYAQSTGSNIIDVAAGETQSILLSSDGNLYVVGSNNEGALCQAEDAPFSENGFVQLTGISDISDVEACSLTSFLIDASGNVLACGSNVTGQTGINDETITRLFGPTATAFGVIDSVRCNSSATLARTTDGTLLSVGRGPLGIVEPSSFEEHQPGPVSTIGTVAAFDVGEQHAVAATGDDVYVWGVNSNGQLGDGSTEIITTENPDGSVSSTTGPPVPPVLSPEFLNNFGPIVDIAAGGAHTLVLLSDGTVWGWGSNRLGQLGTGQTDFDPLLPTEITALTDIVAIEAAGNFSMALDSAGDIYHFGGGILILSDDETTPEKVRGLPQITAMQSSGSHVLAIASDGSVWGWGNALFNQLGSGFGDINFGPILIFDATDGTTTVPAGDPANPMPPEPVDLGSLTINLVGSTEPPADVAATFAPQSYDGTEIAGTSVQEWSVDINGTTMTLNYTNSNGTDTVILSQSDSPSSGDTSASFIATDATGITQNSDGSVTFAGVVLMGSLGSDSGTVLSIELNGTLLSN